MAKFRILINAVQYNRFGNLKLLKVINKVGYSEFKLRNVSVSDYSSNVKYDSLVTIEEYNSATTTYTKIFKGYIRDIKKGSYKTCVVVAHSTAIKLFDRNWTTRKQFTNIAANTIFSDTVNGVMEVGTNSITDIVTTRFELDNKLKSISQLANLTGGEWWESDTATLGDKINLASTRFSTSSVKTFTIGANTPLSDDEIDYDKIYNCITILGRGDGINQVKSTTYGFCITLTTLATTITADTTTIVVDSATDMANTNGIIYINNEKILYGSRTGTTLSSCTRGYGSTIATAHTSGMTIWYAGTSSVEFTKESPATGSSVDSWGIKEYTYSDKRIVQDLTGDPNESCGKVARVLFNKFKEPARTVTILRRNLLLGVVDVGKTITIVDTASGLNGDFKIQSIEINYMMRSGNRVGNALKIIANDLKYNFSTEIEELQKDIDAMGSYKQGATNIYQVSKSDNVDSSHPMDLRFYMPEEAVAVNNVKLNFKMKNYRADSTSVTGSPSSSSTTAQWTSGGLSFMTGEYTTTLIGGVSAFTSDSNFSQNITTSDDLFVRNISASYSDRRAATMSSGNMIDSVISTVHYPAANSETWLAEPFISELSYQNLPVITGVFWENQTAVTSITRTTDTVITDLDRFVWTTSQNVFFDMPSIAGTYGGTKLSISIYNGDVMGGTKTTTMGLYSGGTLIETLNVNVESFKTQTFEYEYVTDVRGETFNLAFKVDSGGLNLKNTEHPDFTTINILATTYIQTTDTLNYGIYENTTEFTPPGTVTVEVGEDGGALTELGVYSADQINLSLSDLIDFEKAKWYNIQITPSETGDCPGGRMRIEANAYIQVYVESD